VLFSYSAISDFYFNLFYFAISWLHFSSSNDELWLWFSNFNYIGQAELLFLISRSRVIPFESYCPDINTDTIKCCAWTTKVVRNNIIIITIIIVIVWFRAVGEMVPIICCSTCFLALHLIITRLWMSHVTKQSLPEVDSLRGRTDTHTTLQFQYITRGLKVSSWQYHISKSCFSICRYLLTRPTQPFIRSGSINWVVTNFIGCVLVAPCGECSRGWADAVINRCAPCVAARWPA